MRPKMITQIIRKLFFCVADVRAIGNLIPWLLMCVIGAFTESTLWRRRITQTNSCQKTLCNRCPVQLGNYFPNNKNVCVIILGLIVVTNAKRASAIPAWNLVLPSVGIPCPTFDQHAASRFCDFLTTTVVSKLIADRPCFRGKPISITDAESYCQKNSFQLQRQVCGNVSSKSLITDTESLLISHLGPS